MNPNHFEGQTLNPKRSKIAIAQHGDLATAQKFNFHAKFQKTKFSKISTFFNRNTKNGMCLSIFYQKIIYLIFYAIQTRKQEQK